MKKPSHEKFFRERENRKNRIHFLKGIGEIVALRAYSFRRRGDVIWLLYNGKKIHPFCEGVTIQTIKKYISDYEANLRKKKKKKNLEKTLKDYCGAPMGICSKFDNCDECNENDKEWALERKEKGEKIVRPKPEDISEERTSLSPIRSKKISFGRFYSWK